jgi:hypothetical protein
MDVKTGKFTKKKMDSTVSGVLAKGEKRLYVSGIAYAQRWALLFFCLKFANPLMSTQPSANFSDLPAR